MTLHSALNLSTKSSTKLSDKGKRDLIAMWEGVDYLVIDEVSMIGCKFLLEISNVLIEAKGCTDPFGGINVIFAGDFAQLPPVGQCRLSSTLKRGKYWQDDVSGQLLW
jgi:hypothetical protein